MSTTSKEKTIHSKLPEKWSDYSEYKLGDEIDLSSYERQNIVRHISINNGVVEVFGRGPQESSTIEIQKTDMNFNIQTINLTFEELEAMYRFAKKQNGVYR